MKSPNINWLTRFAFATIACTALASCAVSPNGPVAPGGSNGSLGSNNMSDYFYHTAAGWTYVYQNVEDIYNSNGTIASTLTAANDTVRTMGFDQIASNGDSLFRYQITYRVAAAYGGRPNLPIYYLKQTKPMPALPSVIGPSSGSFVEMGDTVKGMQTMATEPEPVSTDTILAGIGGLIRTRYNDFTNNSNYVWQTDTIWYSEHNDSAFIWEHAGGQPGTPIVMERCVFVKNFQNGATWTYDVINNPKPTTSCVVSTANLLQVVTGGLFNNTVKIRIETNEVDDNNFNREFKYYGCHTGPILQTDYWYVTADGVNFTMEDFNRQLLSVSQN